MLNHRSACHRCGNIRKSLFFCKLCPYVFCITCVDKCAQEYGQSAFGSDGCVSTTTTTTNNNNNNNTATNNTITTLLQPVCLNLCCCGSNRSESCERQHHCYKKVSIIFL